MCVDASTSAAAWQHQLQSSLDVAWTHHTMTPPATLSPESTAQLQVCNGAKTHDLLHYQQDAEGQCLVLVILHDIVQTGYLMLLLQIQGQNLATDHHSLLCRPVPYDILAA